MYKLAEIESLRTEMVNELQEYMPGFRLAAAYVNPGSIKNPGEKLHRKMTSNKVYKNTAGLAHRTAKAGFFNGATPKTRPWFHSLVSNPTAARTTKVKQFVKKEDDVIAEVMQINNTYRVLPLIYSDTLEFSTGAALMLPHPTYGFWLYPLSIGTYSFACDAEGNPEMFSRDFVYTVKQVVDSFAKVGIDGSPKWDNIHPFIKECYEKSMYNEKVYLTTVIVPNRKWNPLTENAADPLDRKYLAYTYVQRFGSSGGRYSGMSARELNRDRADVVGDMSEFLSTTGFSYFPVIISRWELLAEENFGSGSPTDMCLSDVITFQEMQRARLNAIDKIVRPPMVGPASLKRHQSSILAGGITYVEDMSMGAGFRPAFEVNSRVNELIATQEEYQEVINEAYYVNLFMMLIGQDLKSHVSAQEINARAGEKLQLLGPVLSQWDFDIGAKIISNARHILRAQGRLGPIPQELYEKDPNITGQTPLKIEYISTLALAQKAANLNTMERFLGVTANVSQALQNPALTKIVKDEDYLRNYADSIGLDPTLLRTEDEMAEIKRNEAQQQANMQQRANIAQDADVAKTLSDAKVGDGSMLETMLNASGV